MLSILYIQSEDNILPRRSELKGGDGGQRVTQTFQQNNWILISSSVRNERFKFALDRAPRRWEKKLKKELNVTSVILFNRFSALKSLWLGLVMEKIRNEARLSMATY